MRNMSIKSKTLHFCGGIGIESESKVKNRIGIGIVQKSGIAQLYLLGYNGTTAGTACGLTVQEIDEEDIGKV